MKWGLTRAEHWILILLIGIITIGIGANYYQKERDKTALVIEQLEPFDHPLGADPDKININTATSAELQSLPRVGPALADRIIEYRTQNGPFKSLDDLRNVKGIGEQTIKGFADLVTVGADPASFKTTGPVQPPSVATQGPAAAVPTPAAAAPTATATAPATTQAASSKININTATIQQLDTLPGIGPAYAQRIIEHRTANGPFKTIESIQDVKGIGPATFEKIKDMITVGNTVAPAQPSPTAAAPAAPAQATASTPAAPATSPAAAPAGKININTATLQQLDALPGIGPAYAQRIIDYRTQNGPFKTVDDLGKVSGIGPKTLENLRPLVTVE